MREARRGELLVATPRAVESLAGVQLDALVGSGKDRLEQVDPETLDPKPHLIITTAGKEGGTWTGREGSGRFEVAELPGPLVDEYGAGDTFAAGFTFGLGAGYSIDDALKFAARAGAANLTGPRAVQRSAHGRRLGLDAESMTHVTNLRIAKFRTRAANVCVHRAAVLPRIGACRCA